MLVATLTFTALMVWAETPMSRSRQWALQRRERPGVRSGARKITVYRGRAEVVWEFRMTRGAAPYHEPDQGIKAPRRQIVGRGSKTRILR